MATENKQMPPDTTRIGMGHSFDRDIWGEVDSIIKEFGLTNQDVLENNMLFQRRVNFAKTMAHIELFQKIRDLPGSIVECGVFKGSSLMTFVKLLDIYSPGDTLRRVIGFDTFTGFVGLDAKDGQPDTRRDKVVGGFNSVDFKPALERAIAIAKSDSMIPRFSRVELVEGDVVKTLPAFVKANPGLRISLLHLDVDLYEPTLAALECLYPLVVPGGIVLLDEYGMEGFPGESAAFDEYFAGDRPVLTKFPYISTPGGYFIKRG